MDVTPYVFSITMIDYVMGSKFFSQTPVRQKIVSHDRSRLFGVLADNSFKVCSRYPLYGCRPNIPIPFYQSKHRDFIFRTASAFTMPFHFVR